MYVRSANIGHARFRVGFLATMILVLRHDCDAFTKIGSFFSYEFSGKTSDAKSAACPYLDKQPTNASRSLLSGALGGAIIHVFGFDQADIAQSQPPETNRQTPSRGNFHIAAADQYPRL